MGKTIGYTFYSSVKHLNTCYYSCTCLMDNYNWTIEIMSQVFWVWYFRDNRELCTAFVESIMLSDNTLYLRITTSKHKYIRLSQPTWTVRNHCLLARSSSIVAIYFLLKFYHKILFYRLLVLVMGYFAYFWMNETTGVIRNKINMVLAYKSTPTEIVNKVLDNLSKP